MDHPSSFHHTTFSHPALDVPSWVRSLGRIVSYTLFIIVLGAIAAFLISDIAFLFWLGILLALMVVDYAAHFRSAPYSLTQLRRGNVPNNNIVRCMDRPALYVVLESFERASLLGGGVALHSLFDVVEHARVRRTLQRLGVDEKAFRARIEHSLDEQRAAGILSHDVLLRDAHTIVREAARIADGQSLRSIGPESIFLAILSLEQDEVDSVLDFFALTPERARGAMAMARFSSVVRLPKKTAGFARVAKKASHHRVNRSLTSRPTPALNRVSVDVTDIVRRGGGGFLIGHEKEYSRMIDVLSSPGLSNVLLVGQPGAGKEALVQRLAFDILADDVPDPLFDRRVVQLAIGDVIASSSQEHLSSTVSAIVEEIQHAGNIVLYIPDMHNLARTAESGGLAALDMLLPVLQHSAFPVIGATYPKAYSQFLGVRPDLESSFEMVRVEEISVAEALVLLSYDAVVLERSSGISIQFSAVEAAVELAHSYIRTKPLPASARDVLREAVVEAGQKKSREIGRDEVVDIVERKMNIPIHRAGKDEADRLLHMEDLIHERFVDQDHAVRAVAEALRAYRSGLLKGDGPIATFLFVGPTGVGKTQLSKLIADIHFGSKKALVRFDMSEYQSKADIVRFIGSPDGSIAGALTESVMYQPHSVVLLDEFEKAHPDILNLFLQVFDEGRLTDGSGRTVDFSNTICVATSNAESVFIQERISAGDAFDILAVELKKKLSSYFRPELLNRFSDVVVFTPLSEEDIALIAHLKLDELRAIVTESQGVDLVFDDIAVKRLAQLGYDPAFGARPIDRAIDDNIKDVLAKRILSGAMAKGKSIRVSVDDNGAFLFLEE